MFFHTVLVYLFSKMMHKPIYGGSDLKVHHIYSSFSSRRQYILVVVIWHEDGGGPEEILRWIDRHDMTLALCISFTLTEFVGFARERSDGSRVLSIFWHGETYETALDR